MSDTVRNDGGMNDEAMNDEAGSGQVDALMQRCALALLRVDLDLLSPSARQQARAVLDRSEAEFDGAQLVEICLRDKAPQGPRTLQRAMLALRSRLLGLDAHVASPRRGRGRSRSKRFLASLLVKLIFWPILCVLGIVILVLVQRSWPVADIYVWGGKLLDFLGLR